MYKMYKSIPIELYKDVILHLFMIMTFGSSYGILTKQVKMYVINLVADALDHLGYFSESKLLFAGDQDHPVNMNLEQKVIQCLEELTEYNKVEMLNGGEKINHDSRLMKKIETFIEGVEPTRKRKISSSNSKAQQDF